MGTDFFSEDSTQCDREDGSYLFLKKLGPKTIEIQANPAGLRSFAAQLLRLADENISSIF